MNRIAVSARSGVKSRTPSDLGRRRRTFRRQVAIRTMRRRLEEKVEKTGGFVGPVRGPQRVSALLLEWVDDLEQGTA